jgi:hypothetical protein
MLKLQYVRWRWPCWMEVRVTGHNFENWPPKDHPCHVCFKWAYWFQRRRFLIFPIEEMPTYRYFGRHFVFRNIPSTWSWLNAVFRFECENSAIDVIINFLWTNIPQTNRTWSFQWPITNYVQTQTSVIFSNISMIIYVLWIYFVRFFFIHLKPRVESFWGVLSWHIYLPHAQTAIYDSKVKLFLKQGISRQLGRGWTQFFDLNARIQQLTWSLIYSLF